MGHWGGEVLGGGRRTLCFGFSSTTDGGSLFGVSFVIGCPWQQTVGHLVGVSFVHCCQSGVGQHIAMHATPTAMNFFLAKFYLPIHSPSFLPNLSPVSPPPPPPTPVLASVLKQVPMWARRLIYVNPRSLSQTIDPGSRIQCPRDINGPQKHVLLCIIIARDVFMVYWRRRFLSES